MPGIFEQLSDRLDRLEYELSELRIVPTDPNEIWAEGAIRVCDATDFCGISRSELYSLMNRGELPWSKPARHRLVPRRWLVQYLAKGSLDHSEQVFALKPNRIMSAGTKSSSAGKPKR